MPGSTMNTAWLSIVDHVLATGVEVSPRGRKTLEQAHRTLAVDMNYPVLTLSERKLSYRFMAAEALWIISGMEDVAFLVKYNPNMAAFSDDGVRLAGAYGPRILNQLDYVVETLVEDVNTRRATLSIWTPNPTVTKDYPCTVAMDFKIRHGLLNCHVFMRSSDVWLGLPYDVFSFTMVACEVLRRYNNSGKEAVKIGTLYITAASSHLYEEHWEAAENIIADPVSVSEGYKLSRELPKEYYGEKGPYDPLYVLMDTKRGAPERWWEVV